MKRAVFAIFLTTLFASASQAGYVGQINLGNPAPDTHASLGIMGSGAGSKLVGTGLQAFSVTSAGGTTTTLTGGYLFFTTGSYAGTDSSGNTLYNPGGNFFVLQQNVMGSQPVYTRALTTDAATVSTLNGVFYNDNGVQKPEYQLTMGFSTAIINSPLDSLFGSPTPGLYTGTIQFTYFVDPTQAGNQLLSGSITLTSVPEPSSLVLVAMGGLGVLGYGRRRLKRAA